MVLTLKELNENVKYTDNAFDKTLNLLLAIYPYISRELSDDEKKLVDKMTSLPSYLGGLGYPYD